METKLPYADLDSPRSAPSMGGGGMPGKRSMTQGMAPRTVIYRAADGTRDANGVAADAETAVARASGGSGAPLPTRVQRQFEQSLGTDLSGVRVHTGADSAQAASAVGAKAYTVGNDIHFADGRYQPDDPFGLHLLAHEVAHTAQQSGGAKRRQHKLEVSAPQDAAEHEADRAADAMVAGRPADISGAPAMLSRSDELISEPRGRRAVAGALPSLEAPSPLPEGGQSVPPPAPRDWSGIGAIAASPTSTWGGAPSYEGEYATPGNLTPFRAAFGASWSAGQAAFNRIVSVHSSISAKEGSLPPILDLASKNQKVGAEQTNADATKSFDGDKLAAGASKISSKKVEEPTRGTILKLKDALEQNSNTLSDKILGVANTSEAAGNAARALDDAKAAFSVVGLDAQIEQLGLDKEVVEADSAIAVAEITASAESAKGLSALLKTIVGGKENRIDNFFDFINAGADAGAAASESREIQQVNAKLKLINSQVSKLSASKLKINQSTAQNAIDSAKADVRVALNSVTQAVLEHRNTEIDRRDLCRQLADAMKAAGKDNDMSVKDRAKLAAAVEAIPKIEAILDYCRSLVGGIAPPPYGDASGVGAAMASNYCEFAANVGIIKGTGEHIAGVVATWEARLASVRACIDAATTV